MHPGLAPTLTTDSIIPAATAPHRTTPSMQAELVNMLYAKAPTGIMATLFSASVLVFTLWGTVEPTALLTWFGLITAVTLAWFMLIRQYQQAKPPADQLRRWRLGFLCGVGGVGLLWGVAGVVLFPPHAPLLQMFLVFILGGMAGGAVISLSALPIAFLVFSLPLMLPITTQLFFQGTQVFVSMGVLLVSFVAILLTMMRHFHRTLVESLCLREHNADLIADLSRAKQEAEAANAAKSQFLTAMNHEIRTPMNGVLGMVELLRNTPLTDTQQRFTDRICQSGETLLALSNDVLDLAKVEAGKLELDVVPFDLQQTLDDLIGLFSPQAQMQGVTLSATLSDQVPTALQGDSIRLWQILTNLIENALKFTRQGEVYVRVTQETGSEEEDLLRVEVQDTGVGISPEAQAHIFDSFTQADDSVQHTYGGTGLGLMIAKQLTKLMGGEIGVNSSLGQGSTFWFTARLPQQVTAEGSTVTPSSSGAPVFASHPSESKTPFPAHLLVVEDNPVNQEVVMGMLESLGCTATVAENGRAALNAFTQAAYDLVLMDCQMPEMDGFAAARCIREQEAEASSRRVPIIALTANGMVETQERCLAAGMDDYLGKPFTFEQLQTLLTRWLRHEPMQTEAAASPLAEDRPPNGSGPTVVAPVMNS